MVYVQGSPQAYRCTVREMDLRMSGIPMRTVGSGAARGIVHARCILVSVRGVIEMCEVASEGLFGEMCAKRGLGGVCEVSWNGGGVSEDDSNGSSTMKQGKTGGIV